MGDDRAAENVADAIGRLTRQLDDLKATVTYQATRRPVGDIEPTLRKTEKPGTLFLQGQSLWVADYQDLFTWAQSNGLVSLEVGETPFWVADDGTYFGLPDMRGRAAVGATTVDPVGKSFGSASQTLSVAHMPAHNHFGATGSAGSHWHRNDFRSDGNGGHVGHVNGGNADHPTGAGYLHGHPPAWGDGYNLGHHDHRIVGDTSTTGSHTHSIPFDGSAQPFFLIQPSYAVNWLIWT